jgi:threonine/homoserine/homoserine lactone efflux protein
VIDSTTYGIFLVTAVILVVTPGPDTVLVLSRSLASGTRPGWWTLLGTQAGNVIHAVLAGVGISTLILLLPPAYQALKAAGAVYLIYLAVTTWRSDPRLVVEAAAGERSSSALRYFGQGLANNLVNPKMIPFFLALFPQFIRPEAGSAALQSLILGLTLAGIAVVWLSGLVLVVSYARSVFVRSERFSPLLQRVAALVFAGLAARLALSDR